MRRRERENGEARRGRGLALTAAAFALCLVAWQVVASAGWVTPSAFPGLGQIASAFWSLFTVGYPIGTRFWTHMVVSLGRVLAGVALGGTVAIVLGLAIGWFPTFYYLTRGLITAARGIPAIALIPLAIVWFGINEVSKIALIFYATFWIMLTQVVDAIHQVSPDLVRAGQAFELSPRQLFAWVLFPAVLPRILTALRVGAGIGFVVVIVAEMAGTSVGMGAMIIDARSYYRIDIILVGMALIGLVGFALSTGLERLERRLLRWAAPSTAR